MNPSQTILISRTDSLGDVALTLPICASLKSQAHPPRIVFIGRAYTQALIVACPFIDAFMDWDTLKTLPSKQAVEMLNATGADTIVHVFPNRPLALLAARAKIRTRIGTAHRFYHWYSCTRLPFFSRKKAALHESQLNYKLLASLGLDVPGWERLPQTGLLRASEALPVDIESQLSSSQKVILHFKSQGSALEWGLPNFLSLTKLLLEKGIQVVLTGTEQEGKMFRHLLPQHPLLLDTTGKLTLGQLITLIDSCDGLVAASTGPLHLAGLLGKTAIGLFSPRRPIHPERWKPLGHRSKTLVYDPDCPACKAGKLCKCIEQISPSRVLETLALDNNA